MTVVTEFSVAPAELPLEDALAACPDVTIELERVIPTDLGPMPFFFAWTDEPRSFEPEAETDPDVDELIAIERLEDGGLYRLEWDYRSCPFGAAVVESEGALVEGVGTARRWEFELRFPGNDSVASFREALRDRGVDAEVTRLDSGADVRGGGSGSFGLTDDQFETLVVAFERGYFDEPRTTALADVAGELNVSTAAAAGRLRRALSTLLSNTIMQHRSRPE